MVYRMQLLTPKTMHLYLVYGHKKLDQLGNKQKGQKEWGY